MWSTNFFRLFRVPTALLVAPLIFIGCAVHAQDPTLSPAEQAALEASSPVDPAYLINLCHHALLYGSEEDKANALATLGDRTCAQAIAEGADDEQSPSE